MHAHIHPVKINKVTEYNVQNKIYSSDGFNLLYIAIGHLFMLWMWLGLD